MPFSISTKFLFVIYHLTCFNTNEAKIMRNDALLSKMMSNFQKDNNLSYEPAPQPTPAPPAAPVEEDTSRKNVMSLMKDVLCRNFPSIPCHMILQDATLSKLIQKSIQQIDKKRLNMVQTTPQPSPEIASPSVVINSEDLSSFLHVQNTGLFKDKLMKVNSRQKSPKQKPLNSWYPERVSRKQKNKLKKQPAKQTAVRGRAKLRKFYPHKYKDNGSNHDHDIDVIVSERSASREQLNGRHRQARYRPESPEDPVWRIDYMKHGEPNINGIVEGGQLREKLIRSGGLMVDDDLLEKASRKDVLHPDLYIKTNLVRRNADVRNPESIFK